MLPLLFWPMLFQFAVGGEDSGLDSDSKQFCDRIFDVANQTIIKASQSRDMGAIFLRNQKSSTRLQCQEQCCATASCNVAIFEEKPKMSDGDCFLFDCGSIKDYKCVFTTHEHFVSMGMMFDRSDLDKTARHDESKHELDLQMMPNDKKVEGQKSDKSVSKLKPDTIKDKDNSERHENDLKNSVTQLPERVEEPAPASKIKVSVKNTKDGPSRHMSENGGRVDKAIGKPQSPFEDTRSKSEPEPVVQRQMPLKCESDQFKCFDGSQCIAQYDACDGIPQCDDSSDEGKFCRNIGNVQQPRQNPPPIDTRYPPRKNNQRQNSRYRNDNRNDNNNNNNYRGNDNQYDNNNQYTDDLNYPDDSQMGFDRNSNQRRPKVKDQMKKAPPIKQAARPPAAVMNEPPPKIHKVVAVEPVESLDTVADRGTNIAALILGIGLSLMAILVVFLSCRLRRARKRIRKAPGKILEGEEGDYLINGLYL